MYYFAYGSNMSLSRLRERVPSAEAVGCFSLNGHDLRFHKLSKDGSGKCDAFFTA
jgi:gamma-glutamylcyclotransferase